MKTKLTLIMILFAFIGYSQTVDLSKPNNYSTLNADTADISKIKTDTIEGKTNNHINVEDDLFIHPGDSSLINIGYSPGTGKWDGAKIQVFDDTVAWYNANPTATSIMRQGNHLHLYKGDTTPGNNILQVEFEADNIRFSMEADPRGTGTGGGYLSFDNAGNYPMSIGWDVASGEYFFKQNYSPVSYSSTNERIFQWEEDGYFIFNCNPAASGESVHRSIVQHQQFLVNDKSTGTDTHVQIGASDGGSVASGIILTNMASSVLGKHWVIGQGGVTASNVYRVGYKTTTATEENIPGLATYFFNIQTDGDAEFTEDLTVGKVFKAGQFTATEASALTPANGDFIYVTSTNGTFTSVGFWGYENSAWVKL